MFRASFIIVLILTFGCTKKTSILTTQPEDSKEETSSSPVEDMAIQKYPKGFAIQENKSGNYFIVLTKQKDFKELFATVKYFVFENKTESIILEDELKSGNVKWESDNILRAVHRNFGETETYYYDVIKKSKSISLD